MGSPPQALDYLRVGCPIKAVRNPWLASQPLFFCLSAVGEADTSTPIQDSPAWPGVQHRQVQQPVSPSSSASLLCLPPYTQSLPPIFISQFCRQSVTQARLDGGPGARRLMGNTLGLGGLQSPPCPKSAVAKLPLLSLSCMRAHAPSVPPLPGTLPAASPGQSPA